MNRRSLSILLIALTLRAASQEPIPDSPQHLLPRIAGSRPDSLRVELLLQLGYFYIVKTGENKTDLDSAIFYLNQALQLSQDLHSVNYINQTLKLIGDGYLEGDDLQRGGACFRQAIENYYRMGDTSKAITTWIRWGDCIRRDHGNEKAAAYMNALSAIPDRRDRRLLDIYSKIGSSYIDKPQRTPQDFRQAENYLRLGKQLAARLNDSASLIHFISEMAVYYSKKKEMKKCLACMDTVISYYDRAGDKQKEVEGMINLAYRIEDEYRDQKITWLEKAVRLFPQLPQHDKEFELGILKDLADAHLNEGQLDLAEEELKQVLAGYQSIGYNKLQYTYDLLSAVYSLKGFPDKALSSALQAVYYIGLSGDSSHAENIFFTVSTIYKELGVDDKYLEYAEKVLASHHSFITRCEALNIKINVLIKRGRPAEGLALVQAAIKAGWGRDTSRGSLELKAALVSSYMALNQWSKAEAVLSDLTHTLDAYRKAGVDRGSESRYYGIFYYNICSHYIRMHRYREAELALRKIEPIRPRTFAADELAGLHYLHFKIDSAYGRHAKALREYALYSWLHDSIFNVTKNRQFQELEMSLEAEKKERAIAGLQNADRLQRAELSKARTGRDFTVAGIFLTLIIAILSFWGWRQKQRSNKMLQAHKLEIDARNVSLAQLNDKQSLLLAEREWLMREIHHRVKNNLQTTISLLHMQSAYLSNDEAQEVILNSQRRMQAMALIHQQLYASDDMASIDMSPYITRLVSSLKESFHGAGNIVFDVSADQVTLDISRAVPIGLIINETVTNAIKYAFPDDGQGKVLISLKAGLSDCYMLTIADNGIGMPPDFDADQGSLGLSLIRGLTDQLQGECRITGHKGVNLSVVFSPDLITG